MPIVINDTTTISDLISMNLTEVMDMISKYATERLVLFMRDDDDIVLKSLITESCSRNSIISKLSLEHLQQLPTQYPERVAEKLNELDEKAIAINFKIEEFREQQRVALSEFEDGIVKEIDSFSVEEKEFIKKKARALGEGIVSDIKKLSLDLSFPDQIETLEGCFTKAMNAEAFKTINSHLLEKGIITRIDEFINVADFLKLPAKIMREQRQLKGIDEYKGELNKAHFVLSGTETSSTFSQFLDESLTNLRVDLEKDLKEHRGFIHQLLECKTDAAQTAGISFAFGLADPKRVATVMPSFNDKMYHCLVIPMSDTISRAARSYYGSRSTHFDTLGHEALHLTSMRLGLTTQAPMFGNDSYANDVVKAIDLIKGQSGLYSATHSDENTVINEDEVIANFVGDIVLNDPTGEEYAGFIRRLRIETRSNPAIKEVISGLFSRYSSIAEERGLSLLQEACNKVVTGCSTIPVVEVSTTSSSSLSSMENTTERSREKGSGSGTFAASNSSSSSLEVVPKTHKDSQKSSKLAMESGLSSSTPEEDPTKTNGTEVASGSPAAKKIKREEGTSTSSSSAAAELSEEGKNNTTETTNEDGFWASQFKPQKGKKDSANFR